MAPRVAVVALALSLLWAVALAMPSYYVGRIDPRDCLTHPLETCGPFDYITNTVKPSVRDENITFVVKSVDTGALAATVCPGAFYEVNVTFPVRRFMLLTCGLYNCHWADAPDRDTINKWCPNRTYYDAIVRAGTDEATPAPETSFVSNLFMPCNAKGKINLKVTSATGDATNFIMGACLWNVITLDIDPTCQAARCDTGRVG